jgi:Zn-dependent protease with chaperone function
VGLGKADAVGLLQVVEVSQGGHPSLPASAGRQQQQTALDALLRNMDHHFRTHPPTPQRIDRIQKMNP